MPLTIKSNEIDIFLASFRYFSGYAICKDLNSVYLTCNDNLAKLTGFNHASDVFGKSDYDLKCVASRDADVFQENDKMTFELMTDTQWLCFNSYADDWKLVFGQQIPICDQTNKAIALQHHFNDISHIPLLSNGSIFQHVLWQKIKKRRSFMVNVVDNYPQLNLSKRQAEVLFYILHDFSAKEISQYLYLSHRTISRHLEDIKLKLQCTNRSQLMEKAMANRWFDFLIKS